jgi:hypothetical protein
VRRDPAIGIGGWRDVWSLCNVFIVERFSGEFAAFSNRYRCPSPTSGMKNCKARATATGCSFLA